MDRETVATAVDLLLASAFNLPQDGRQTSFMFGRPGARPHDVIGGAEVHYTKIGLLRAALHVRSRGPLYLRNLSIRELEGKLSDFLIRNYGYMANEVWFDRSETCLATLVSKQTKAQLEEALAGSDIFRPDNVPTLFPLVPIKVESDFDSQIFFLVAPASLNVNRIGHGLDPRDLIASDFPPVPDWKGRREQPASWLGVRSPTLSSSKKARNAILGSIALLPHPRERHLFTGRKMFGGQATYDGRWSMSWGGEPHTPALSENIVIDEADHVWLVRLSRLLEDPAKKARQKIRALEYYYRAWSLDEVERFPVLFMALDAIFGDAGQATQAVIDAVGPIMGPTYTYERLRLLLSLRGSVIHGGAPDVYDSKSYVTYFEKHNEDPIFDLELIAANCLQAIVFEGKLKTRRHTYAELLKTRGIDTEAPIG